MREINYRVWRFELFLYVSTSLQEEKQQEHSIHTATKEKGVAPPFGLSQFEAVDDPP